MRSAAEVLRNALPPKAFALARTLWRESRYRKRLYAWYLTSYFPRLVQASFVTHPPDVRSFPNSAGSALAAGLRTVNLVAPTDMCRVMTRHGSDKGNKHNYTTIYSKLFGPLRNDALRIFELGLGSTDPKYPASMGGFGRPGASLRGWSEIFPAASVYGADIDRETLFTEDRIATFYCDQCDAAVIRDMWLQPALRGGMDIIIDDGFHDFDANVRFLGESLRQLRPGGIYVVEDIESNTLDQWNNLLESVLCRQFPDFEFALASLPNPGKEIANNLLFIRRQSAPKSGLVPL
jgi:hypothetical protein